MYAKNAPILVGNAFHFRIAQIVRQGSF